MVREIVQGDRCGGEDVVPLIKDFFRKRIAKPSTYFFPAEGFFAPGLGKGDINWGLA
jgi:hypothetical protein